MPPYQWLLFDADGTLFDYERAEAAALARAFQRYDIPFKPDFLKAYRGYNQTLWLALEKGLISPDALKVRRFELLFAALGMAHSAAEFSAVYLDCLAERSELIDGARDMLDALQSKCRMAILTNGLQAVQRARLARSAIREHISDIVVSEEIGFAKPAKEFFDAAFARLGNPSKREVLMIGDNWSSDIQGASRYGLDTCWFNPSRQPRPDDPEITLEVASLRQLTGWLQQKAP
jgi:YjjG family noncanonical pyrimidine nucleotidase